MGWIVRLGLIGVLAASIYLFGPVKTGIGVTVLVLTVLYLLGREDDTRYSDGREDSLLDKALGCI